MSWADGLIGAFGGLGNAMNDIGVEAKARLAERLREQAHADIMAASDERRHGYAKELQTDSQKFQSGEAESERGFRSEEAEKTRKFESQEGGLDRTSQEKVAAEANAMRERIAKEANKIQNRMLDADLDANEAAEMRNRLKAFELAMETLESGDPGAVSQANSILEEAGASARFEEYTVEEGRPGILGTKYFEKPGITGVRVKGQEQVGGDSGPTTTDKDDIGSILERRRSQQQGNMTASADKQGPPASQFGSQAHAAGIPGVQAPPPTAPVAAPEQKSKGARGILNGPMAVTDQIISEHDQRQSGNVASAMSSASDWLKTAAENRKKQSEGPGEIAGRGYGNRQDGSPKGSGFLGELKTPDGNVATEISIGVEIDGREIEIPALVPTLTKEEVDYLLSGKKPTQQIVDKAVAHAKKRMAAGMSVFAENQSDGRR